MAVDFDEFAVREAFGSRDAWWAARSTRDSGVGASESASVLGVCPWSGATDVWLKKTGRSVVDRQSIAMRVGSALEPFILDIYREETRNDVLRFDQSSWLRSKAYDWMTCTPDAYLEDGTLVEAKSIEIRNREQAEQWGREGTDEVPYHYLIQVHHQMVVTGAKAAEMAVLVGKSEFRRYTVRRNEDLAAKIVGATGIFWRECVLADVPPDEEFVPSVKLLKVYPGCEGAIDLGDDVMVYVAKVERLREASKGYDEEKARYTSAVLKAMGNAQFGRLPDGRLVKRIVERIPERTQVVKAHERQRFIVVRGA